MGKKNKLFKNYSNNIFIEKTISNDLEQSKLEEIVVTSVSKNKKLVSLLSNRKFTYTVSILLFVFVCILVGKNFYYKSKFVTIRQRQDEEVRINEYEIEDVSELKNPAADEYVNCIKQKVNKKDLSSEVNSVIKKINDYYGQSRNYFAFKYVDIYTGFSVSYNENQKIFAASSIKAPTDLYIWEMASLGKINLDDKLKYTLRYYNTGSGKLKNGKFNVNYTIRDLLKYSTVDSDNAAHNMLEDKFGRKNMLKFWKEKGTKAIFTQNNNWGPTSAHDAAIYMMELYRFYTENKEYGEAAMNNFLKAHPKFISNPAGYKIANKAGWAGSSAHDVGIVFADNPYIIVALSNLGGQPYKPYFKKASELAYELHTAYWKYKVELCGDIKQY